MWVGLLAGCCKQRRARGGHLRFRGWHGLRRRSCWGGAVAFKLGESDENGFGLGVASGSNDAAEADESVASPVEKPGIAGDDGL